MTTQQSPPSLTARLAGHLPLLEKILLATLLFGAILAIMKIDLTVAKVSLLGLGVIYFVLANRPIDVPGLQDVPLGFSELLGILIVPKVLWISAAISALGIAFYIFDFGNPGYRHMLMIGALSIGIATLVFVVLLVSGVKYIRVVIPVLLRAVPICLIDLYILFK